MNPQNEIPVSSLETLSRSTINLFAAGFANGLVKLISCSTGTVMCEVSAHSRSLNALVCHPFKPIFATCSDDTFTHVFEVTGDKNNADINLVLGSRVNDYQLCGLTFCGTNSSSLLAAPYDYKSLVVLDNIV